MYGLHLHVHWDTSTTHRDLTATTASLVWYGYATSRLQLRHQDGPGHNDARQSYVW